MPEPTSLPFLMDSEKGQEALRLAKLRDPESRARLERLLEDSGAAPDLFVGAEEHEIPDAGEVVLGGRVCAYSITDRVMQIEGAVPVGLCRAVVERAEENAWRDSTQVSAEGQYTNENRTSRQQLLTPGGFGELADQLRELFYEAGRFYWCWNEHVGWAGDSGWEVVRYQPGERFGEHVDAVQGTDTTARVLSTLLYLNEDFKGGATRFHPPASGEVHPVTGRLLLFPPYWTHPHEGLPPKRGTKYVALGWFVR